MRHARELLGTFQVKGGPEYFVRLASGEENAPPYLKLIRGGGEMLTSLNGAVCMSIPTH